MRKAKDVKRGRVIKIEEKGGKRFWGFMRYFVWKMTKRDRGYPNEDFGNK